MFSFRIGDQVYWWKRISNYQVPHRAEVVAVRSKRIAVSVEDPDDANSRFLRHVAAHNLQPIATYFEMAENQGPSTSEPVASWGQFTRYIEVGEDLRALRQVDAFANGQMLSYDRVHWVDRFGMLGDARINRNCKAGSWGVSKEIEADEFERVWLAARASANWPDQEAAAEMERKGALPPLLANKS